MTEDYIIKNDGILYGGFALNALLPKELKFYDNFTLPDYDCFISDADEKSKELADDLLKNDYKYTEVKHALHENTYKLFSNFESVADFTSLKDTEYKQILKKAEIVRYNKKRIKVCPKDLLKALAYYELCLPIGASHRWIKVYKRLLLFETAFPVLQNMKSIKPITISEISKSYIRSDTFYDLYNTLKQYMLSEKVVFTGLYAIMYLLDTEMLRKKTKYLEVLSIDPEKHLKYVLSILIDLKCITKVVTNNEYSNIIPIHVDVYVKLSKTDKFEKLLTIYDVTSQCFSYFKKDNKFLTSIYFELYKLYVMRFIEGENIMTNNFITLLTNEILLTDDKEILNFTSDCYGYTKTLSVMKKSIWDNKKKILFYRPLLSKQTRKLSKQTRKLASN